MESPEQLIRIIKAHKEGFVDGVKAFYSLKADLYDYDFAFSSVGF